MCRLPALLALVAMTFFASCSTTPSEPDPSWISGEIHAPSEGVLWTSTLTNLGRLGYPVGSQANRAAMTIVTGWKNQLAPFRGKGFRQKVDMSLVRQAEFNDQGHPIWDVTLRVMTQANMSLVRPLDPSYAEWEWRDDDALEASIILRHIQTDFLPPDILLREDKEAETYVPSSVNPN